MITLTDRLMRRKARLAAEQIVEGGMTAEQFERFWKDQGEAACLADMADAGELDDPKPEKPFSQMTAAEKVAYRDQHGNDEFCRKIQKG